jgi:[Skp1-protein]-hydroxyproline N-acetylglucosaminyltransferase
MLQIDAHMRFRPNWDVYLIQQLQQCPDPTKAVLTTYPVGYSLRHSNNNNTTLVPPNETRGTLLVPWKFDNDDESGDGMLRIRGRLFQEQLPRGRDEPVPCHLYAAGFNFCVAHGVLRDCPYDGSLHHLFFGEEMSMAVRLFTWGYDLLAPAQTVVYHLWERDHRPPPLSQPDFHDPHAGNAAAEERAKALQRVRKQLLGRGEGLGSVRTVLQLEAAIGVNFDDLTIRFSEDEYEIKRGVTFAKPACSGIDFSVGGLGANTKSLILEFLGGNLKSV